MLFSVKAVVVVVFDVVAAAFSFAVAVVLKQFYNNFAEKNNNLPLMEQQRTKQQHQTKDTKRTAQLEPIPSRTDHLTHRRHRCVTVVSRSLD